MPKVDADGTLFAFSSQLLWAGIGRMLVGASAWKAGFALIFAAVLAATPILPYVRETHGRQAE